VEERPKLDYATPQKNQPPPITTADRVIGFLGFVRCGLLTVLSATLSVDLIHEVVEREHYNLLEGFALCFSICAFCAWRAVAAFRQFLRSAKS
jgi:hypothetical protein